jgi:uroporphyrinogen III methyltransferase / synthase
MNDAWHLAGKRIAITRAREQASVLRQKLEGLGAKVIEIPTIEIRDPVSWEPLDEAIGHLENFDFLLLTSANGAKRFLARLRTSGRNAAALRHLEIGAIGPATASVLTEAGAKVDFIPRQYRAEGLLAVLAGRDLQGKAFLIPRAKIARDLVPRVLREHGAEVKVVEAYETVAPDLSPAEIHRLFTPPADMITFTSSSTASHLAQLLGPETLRELLARVVLASIGPITSETVRALGLEVAVEASESTIPGLVRAIAEYFTAPVGDTGH